LKAGDLTKDSRIFLAVSSFFRRTDKLLWLLMLTISTFSLILLKSVSRAMNTDYFKTQLVVTVAGLLAALVLSFIDYESIASFWYLIAGFSVFIMLYTMFFGISVQGSEGVNARAWISLAGRTFQTSELVKICFMLTYAKHISVLRVQNKINHPLHVVLLALHAAVPVLLCHVQGDDGAAIVFFFMFLCMSLGGGVQLRYFILLGALVAVSVPVLWKFVLSEYQIKRFTSVYNLDDPSIQLNEGYQQVQGRISIGSGQLTGKGLFNGPRVETNLVTFQHSDFIFSVAGEELGFIGALIVIILFALFIWRGVYIALHARDRFGTMLALGITFQFGVQAILNICVVTNTIPNTGISLPFFSFGGTALIMLLAEMGVLLSVSRHSNTEKM
jgi:rod shape determining protein RodA